MPTTTTTDTIEISADGFLTGTTRTVDWQLRTPERMCTGVVIGRSNDGGTTLLAALARTVQERAVAEVWAIEPHSWSGRIAPYAVRTAGGPGATADMLAALEDQVRQRRADQAAGRGPDARTLVLIDDAHRVFTPADAERWAWIAARGPAVGIGVAARLNRPDLSAYGSSTVLRQAMEAHNRIIL